MPILLKNDLSSARSNFSVHRLRLRRDGELRPKLKAAHALGRRAATGSDAQPIYRAPRISFGLPMGWRPLDLAKSLAFLRKNRFFQIACAPLSG